MRDDGDRGGEEDWTASFVDECYWDTDVEPELRNYVMKLSYEA